MKQLTYALLALFLAISGPLSAQVIQLDPGFDHQPATTGFSGSQAYSISVLPDNKIIMAGGFNSYNSGFIPAGIARLNPDGTLDNTFNAGGTGSFGAVYVHAVQSDGKILIGGDVLYFNGVAMSGLARLHADGTLDTTFQALSAGPGGGTPLVKDMLILPDGKIMICGGFKSYAGVTQDRIARLHPDGTLDNSFVPPTGMLSSTAAILCMARQSDGKIVVGGSFREWGGVELDRIARLNTDGSLDNTFLADPSYNTDVSGNSILDVEVLGDGKILAVGDFGNALQRIKGIVRFDASGNIDTGFNANGPQGLAGANYVQTIAFQSDGKIIIGGGFTSYNGVDRDRIARLSSDGDLDTTFDTGDGFDWNVNMVRLQPDGKILAVGAFDQYGAGPDDCSQVARLLGGGPVAVEEWMDTVSGLDLFPNPTSGDLSLRSAGAVIERIRILDIHGKVLMDRVRTPAFLLRISTEALPAGLYLLEVTTGDGKESLRFVRN